MKNKISLIFSMIAMAFVLAACGGSSNKEVVNVYNWGEYIDTALLDKFEEETGIEVKYDMFTTNEDMYVKLKSSNISYDILVPSDYMIERMKNEGMLQPINFENVPNYANVDDTFKNQTFDENNEYSAPYFWGTLGIVYNKEMVQEPVTSWDILWDDKYENQIIMMDSSRDSIGVALKKLGYSLNSKNESELEEAKQELIAQKPIVRAYLMDETKDMMKNGEAALAVMYSGDAADAISENPNLEYVIPQEGSNIFIDAMVIPANATNKENAEKFINFMLDVNNAAQNASIGYSTPISAAKQLLDDDMKNNEAAYPDQATLDALDLETFRDPAEMLERYDSIWQDVKSN